jgi:hypothetical protein
LFRRARRDSFLLFAHSAASSVHKIGYKLHRFHFHNAWVGTLSAGSEARCMNEIVFLIGFTAGVAIGVPPLVRLWQVNLRAAFERV